MNMNKSVRSFVLLLSTLTAACMSPSISSTEQANENDVCNYPFFTACYPSDPFSVHTCATACAPRLGYCPEYVDQEYLDCRRICSQPPLYMDPNGWCLCDHTIGLAIPTGPHRCLEGAAAVSGPLP